MAESHISDQSGNFFRGKPEPEEINYGPEVNLHQHVKCGKNPGHTNFIPIGDLNINHWPKRHRSESRVERIRAMADLTVCIRATTVSRDRPKFYPTPRYPFPFHCPGGGTQFRTGSGFVGRVDKCGDGDQTCDCNECVASSSPKASWWILTICTALHVIYDTSEVRDAQIKFFYDRVDSKTVVATGERVIKSDIHGDLCTFTVIIHDEEMGRRLKRACKKYWTYRLFIPPPGEPVVIVSHPHGLPKHVTLGRHFGTGSLKKWATCQIYSADTCPGSSGGLVLSNTDNFVENLWFRGHVHSAALSNGHNRSGEGWKWFW